MIGRYGNSVHVQCGASPLQGHSQNKAPFRMTKIKIRLYRKCILYRTMSPAMYCTFKQTNSGLS